MHILFSTIVKNYVKESKPINGIVHIGAYDAHVHDQYKCHSKDEIVWINRNDIEHIQQDNLLQNVQPHNFLNVTLSGQELQVLHTFQQFINEHVDYVYTQIYDSEDNGKCTIFRDLNMFMILNNFKLEAYNMVNKTGVTHYGGALYVRIS